MKLTRTHILIGSIAGLALIIFVVWLIIQHASPPDTPIVIGGGSIYGKTSPKDTDGWTAVDNLKEYGKLHPGPVQNPHGIDELTFTNFDTSPNPNPERNTGGWAILIRNPLPPPNTGPNPIPAVSVCSDATCSAAAPGCDPKTFDKKGAVYFNVRANAQITRVPGSGPGTAIGEIDFHDTTSGCTPDTCDKIYDVALKTCNGGVNPVFTTTCNTNPKSCDVQVGH